MLRGEKLRTIREVYGPGKFALSFEVFPPKNASGMEPLYKSVAEFAAYKPGFISCTYGAGGTTRDQTLDIVQQIRTRFGLPVTAHFTCVGSTVDDIRSWMTQATAVGVENIMALRGDPPKGEERFTAVAGGFANANELVAFLKKEFPNFGVGVAGYPETHQEAIGPEEDLRNLHRKVVAGGDAIFTQLFYDNVDFLRFRDRCRALGITKPIIPGLLPVLSLAQVERITSLCKARLPGDLKERLRRCGDNAADQIAVGVEHCTRQCEGLLREGVGGIHFYVLNRSDATCRILENVRSQIPKAPAP